MMTQSASLITVAILASLSFFIQMEASDVRPRLKAEIADDVGYVWNPVLYRILSTGQTPLALDWLLLKFLTSQDWEHVAPGKHAKQFYDLDLATEVDPAFMTLYTAGANFLTVVRNDNLGAQRIINKGENFRSQVLHRDYGPDFVSQHWPNEWRVPFIRAFIELFEMKNLKGAAEALSVIDQFPDAPDFLKSLGKRLADPVERYDVALRILEQGIRAGHDDRERDILLEKRRSVLLARFVAISNVEFNKYLAMQKTKIDSARKQNLFTTFVRAHPQWAKDPAGGDTYLTEMGRIETRTPRDSVYIGE
ncbi:MAG: hypothetical protein EOP09_06750 [Proteobacteria bacterium]|nr:MAG: hypothetical protein EOP09_06750 [Pseudomonadota bacterium]